ncbi:MAG: hypothetical protein ACRCXA_10300, partial [Peptostreptococcaceae bacterium]
LSSRMAMLEYIIKTNKVPSRSIIKELIYSNKLKKECNELIECMSIENKEVNPINIKILLNKIGAEISIKALELKKIYYENYNLNNNDIMEEDLSNIDKTIDKIKKIEINNECYKIKNLDISGNDIEMLGYKGKDIGEKLKMLLDKVIENPSLNEKKILKTLL